MKMRATLIILHDKGLPFYHHLKWGFLNFKYLEITQKNSAECMLWFGWSGMESKILCSQPAPRNADALPAPLLTAVEEQPQDHHLGTCLTRILSPPFTEGKRMCSAAKSQVIRMLIREQWTHHRALTVYQNHLGTFKNTHVKASWQRFWFSWSGVSVPMFLFLSTPSWS